MANYYCQSSSFLPIPEDKIESAKSIIARWKEEHEEEDVGLAADTQEDGVWFHHFEEAFDPEVCADLALTLLNELDIAEPFTFSWAYTCSKPRIDQFGGGACSVMRGKKPYFVNAMDLAQIHFSEWLGGQ